MGIKPFRSRPLGIHKQLAYMKLYYPSFACHTKDNKLVCRGVVQPTPLHESYRVRIVYRVGHAPQTWIEEPKLRRRSPDESTPHTYSDDRPCLYLPRTGEWSSEKPLALTIVPWLSLWLLFYESWLVTGKWQGEGLHPPSLPRTKEHRTGSTS